MALNLHQGTYEITFENSTPTLDDDIIDIEETIYKLTVPQRLERLICGYVRINSNKFSQNAGKLEHLANDISVLCSQYTGINGIDCYHLIISNLEVRDEDERKKRYKRHMTHYNEQIIAKAYKAHYWDAANKLTVNMVGIYLYLVHSAKMKI